MCECFELVYVYFYCGGVEGLFSELVNLLVIMVNGDVLFICYDMVFVLCFGNLY